MPILYGGAKSSDFVTPGIYIEEQVPTPPEKPGGYTSNLLAIIGVFEKGPLTEPVIVNGLNDFLEKCGNFSSSYSGSMAAYAALQRGVQMLAIINVRGDMAKQAEITLLDKDAKPTLAVRHMHKCEFGNSCSVEVQAGNKPDTFRLILRTPYGKPEVYNDLSTPAHAVEKVAAHSKDFIVEELAHEVQPGSNPDVLAETKLAGGSDGKPIKAADYLGKDDPVTYKKTGLKLLKTLPQVTDFVADKYISDQFSDAMLAAAQEMNAFTYIPVPDTSIVGAISMRQNYDTEFGHYVLGQAKSKSRGWVVPAAVYDAIAHVLCPVQDGTAGFWFGDIESTDIPLTTTDIENLTANQVACLSWIVNEKRENAMALQSDFTLSADARLRQTYRRRVNSLIVRDLEMVTTPYRSKHLSDGWFAQYEIAVRHYLDKLKGRLDDLNSEVIQDYKISFRRPDEIGNVDEAIEELRIKLFNIADKITIRLMSAADLTA